MKFKLYFLLLIFSINIFPSIIFVYDSKSYETIEFVVISHENEKEQIKTPFIFPKGKKLSIHSTGYKDIDIDVDKDTIFVYLEPNPFLSSPYIVEKERLNGDVLKVKIKNEDLLSSLKKVPSANIREYNRTKIISIDGLLNENVQILIDGVPVVNQQSKIVPITLLPQDLFSSLSIYKNHYPNIVGENIFAAGIDFNIRNENKAMARIKFEDSFLSEFENSLSFRFLKTGFYFFERKDIVLPKKRVLFNSYQKGKSQYFYINNKKFSFLFFKGDQENGDPGILGHRFFDSKFSESMKIINLKFSLLKYFSFIFSNSVYGYLYDNNDIQILDSSYTSSYNTILSYLNSFGIFSQKNILKSSRISYCEEFYNGFFSNLKFNNFYFTNTLSFSYSLKDDLKDKKNFLYSFVLKKEIFFKNQIFETVLKISTRRPTFNELYWSGDVFAKGNPYLKNEKMFSLFSNIVNENMKFTLGFNYYNDLIRWINESGIYTPQNILNVYNPYFELVYRKKLLFFDNSFAINFSPMFIDNFKILLYTSPLNFNYYLNLSYKNFNFSTFFEYRFKRFTNNQNTKFLKEYYLLERVDLEYVYNPFILKLTVKNPFDITYETVKGYISEGRKINFMLKMEVL